MKPAISDLRRTRSRLYATPLPSKPYELLAILGAVLCLVAHFLAIGELNAIASQGGVIKGDLPGGLRVAIGFSIAGFAVSLLALLRIWWQGHVRQGVMLAAYGLIVNPWMLYMIGWTIHRGPKHSFGLTQIELNQAVFYIVGLCFGAILYFAYAFSTRRVRKRHGPLLTVGLVLAFAAGVAGAARGTWMAFSRYESGRFEAHRQVLPESTTAVPWANPIWEYYSCGLILGARADGTPTYRYLHFYMDSLAYAFGTVPAGFEEVFVEPEDPLADARWGLDEMDKVVAEDRIVPEQVWLDNTLYVALAPEHLAAKLDELFTTCREVFPERRRVTLLACRRHEIDWTRTLLLGGWHPVLHMLPLEVEAIADAPVLRVDSTTDGLRFNLDGDEIESESFLAGLLAHRSPDGVNLHPSPDLTITEVVHAIDLLRSAGVQRIAWP